MAEGLLPPARLAEIRSRLDDLGYCNLTPVTRADLKWLLAEREADKAALRLAAEALDGLLHPSLSQGIREAVKYDGGEALDAIKARLA